MTRVVLLSLGLLILVGCFSGNRLPGPGDTVAPRIVQPINWLAGEMGEIYVDLSAKNEGGNVRQLGFAASPVENPVASVVFYDATGAVVAEEDVELSQRC